MKFEIGEVNLVFIHYKYNCRKLELVFLFLFQLVQHGNVEFSPLIHKVPLNFKCGIYAFRIKVSSFIKYILESSLLYAIYYTSPQMIAQHVLLL